MENKNVGYLLLGISLVVFLIIFLFNSALTEIIDSTCTMAGHTSCTMDETLNRQTYLSLGIASILVLVSLFLIFSKSPERIIIKKIKDKKELIKLDTSGLREEEKKVLDIVKNNKTIFQAELIEKTNFGKAKVSRILDKLENRGFVERKRRGMTNIVVLKDN